MSEQPNTAAENWEHNARHLLTLSIELVQELIQKCDDPIHQKQLSELREVERQWKQEAKP